MEKHLCFFLCGDNVASLNQQITTDMEPCSRRSSLCSFEAESLGRRHFVDLLIYQNNNNNNKTEKI